MGEEITKSSFGQEEFAEYEARLARETALLGDWFTGRHFTDGPASGGFEVEACLVDDAGLPAGVNEPFLAQVDSPLVVSELAVFNVEINTPPVLLSGGALRGMHDSLRGIWQQCNRVARGIDAELLLVGILPTLAENQLTLANMSHQQRYRALNEQVFRIRRGAPLALDIVGREHLQTVHRDVMLEAAATSFQVHLQVRQAEAVRRFNAAIVLSAPLVAVSANSPYLFGQDLWDETRIPLFEQAVATAGTSRVTFGFGYARTSLWEYFQENRITYDVLLPVVSDAPVEQLTHVRLHNGTIWRWNRPLIGFSADGAPHLRIEHRVMPAGPSLIDAVANAALFFGLVETLSRTPQPLEERISFATARANFYAAARHGLRAEVTWTGANRVPMGQLLTELLPLARAGLNALGLAPADIELYLGVIAARLKTGQNGAAWQRAYVAKHGRDMRALTCAYRERQRSGAPVHEWTL